MGFPFVMNLAGLVISVFLSVTRNIPRFPPPVKTQEYHFINFISETGSYRKWGKGCWGGGGYLVLVPVVGGIGIATRIVIGGISACPASTLLSDRLT